MNLKCLLGVALCSVLCARAEFTVETAQQQEVEAWKTVENILAKIKEPRFPDNMITLKDFGAKGNGKFDNRPVFEKAISALSEDGGGKLVVPQGTYYVDGPIVMQSNIHLEVLEGATIRFSSKAESYLPAVIQRWEGTVCYNYSPLIRGHNLTNIALTGKGTIDGDGVTWAKTWVRKQKVDQKLLRKMGYEQIPDEQRVFGNGFLDLNGDGKDDGFGDGQEHWLRPPLIQFYNCENVLFEGLTIQNSPFWTVHPVFCKNVIARNLTIIGKTINSDGFDPDSCEYVLIEGCDIRTGDDSIAIKAGRDNDAWDRGPSRNIIIRNNTLGSKHNALCIGSEMSGGVENVFAENNKALKSSRALNFKCNLDRGGYVRQVYIRNMEVESCNKAMILFTMKYHGHRGGKLPPDFSDIFITGLVSGPVAGTAFDIVGVPNQPLRRIFISDVAVEQAKRKERLEHTEDLVFNNVTVKQVALP